MIRFENKSGSGFSMVEEDAKQLLGLMKHSSDVPGTIPSQDISAYLQNLQSAIIAESSEEQAEDITEDEPAVVIGTRAYPLIELFKMSLSKDEDIFWRQNKSGL
ncbi:DUF1840 family protein [Leucothrix arctica]|uniref:DUF1840 domain-containing protein n=1 Tax=Leucothrix arctica TaxID=1481894 RepID=A0A317C5F0_9GAMM|nr:DUF1840 family protein [Leucothrix arctica]PWQ93828.1 hypothetical protein DKT75_19695 [Leucothrix arctica]